MKKLILLLFLLFQVSFGQSDFETGNLFYAKENYKSAIVSYENVLTSGKQSADVYFNLGNCYYKLHQIAPAIYNFEKALLLNPKDVEIRTNLEFARKMTIDDIKVIPKVGFHKIIANFTSTYHYDTWAWIATGLSFLFFTFFLGYYFSGTTIKKRTFFFGMFLSLLAILLSVSSAIFERDRMEVEKPAIIFAEVAALKTEPKLTANDAILLHEGTKVYILESIANWKKVQLTDETTGWIESASIKELK
ncbi:tetratricopeptide repeat protein [Flavobacterium sp.]